MMSQSMPRWPSLVGRKTAPGQEGRAADESTEMIRSFMPRPYVSTKLLSVPLAPFLEAATLKGIGPLGHFSHSSAKKLKTATRVRVHPHRGHFLASCVGWCIAKLAVV